MPATWVSDLKHFLDSQGEISPHAYSRSLVRQLCSLVEEVTGSPTEGSVARAVQCRRRPNRQRCEGIIEAGFEPEKSTIRWGCPVCGDNGWISGWHRTRWDRGGRAALPEVRRVFCRRGFVHRLREVDRLPSFELSGSEIPLGVIVAIHDNEMIGASGKYGVPEIGEPIQYDELRIEHGKGTDTIVVYNHAIMLFKTNEGIYPRVLRVLSAIDQP